VLLVNGSILSATTVNAGGTGAVGPTSVFGTIAPGLPGSIGTLTVNGAYVMVCCGFRRARFRSPWCLRSCPWLLPAIQSLKAIDKCWEQKRNGIPLTRPRRRTRRRRRNTEESGQKAESRRIAAVCSGQEQLKNEPSVAIFGA